MVSDDGHSTIMKLLGDRNWYLPSVLTWLPDVRVEADARTAGVVAEGD